MVPPPERLRRCPLKGAPLAAWQSQFRGGRWGAPPVSRCGELDILILG